MSEPLIDAVELALGVPQQGYSLADALNKSPLHIAARAIDGGLFVIANPFRRWTAGADMNPIFAANVNVEQMYGEALDWFPILSDASGVWRIGV